MTPLKRYLQWPWKLVKGMLGWTLALVILFEEWGWEPLQHALARIGQLPGLRWIEQRIRALGPAMALVLLVLPSLILLPVKLSALWLIGQGQWLMGTLGRVAGPLI